MTWWGVLTIAAALSVAPLMASPASATPTALGSVKAARAGGASATTPVHWRRYRHCHWRHGRRVCHGRRHHRRYYYDGWYGLPGVGIYFGGRRHHHRHHHRGRKRH